MGFTNMFAIGLSGVNAYASSLEAVSNNIANTDTTGYKRLRTDFSTLVTMEAPNNGVAGGGVGATTRQLISEQGGVARTSSPTDLAVSGNGFFVVSENASDTDTSAFLFTRSGGFSIQEDGTLMNEAGYFLRAAAVGEDGTAAANGLSGLETVNVQRISSLAAATSAITLAGNLDANAPLGETVTQNVQVFDDTGAARTLALTFTRIGLNEWAANAAFVDGGQESIAAGDIVFAADGRIDEALSSFPQSLTISANAGQAVDLNLRSLIQTARATSFSTAQADGAAEGALTGVEISRDGRITALFSNGLARDIYQVVLANFINPDGLKDGPASTFLTSSDAGEIALDIPQTGRAGAIESGALEMSTVDIGQEFSMLIETQRAYAANTRVISVADELWRTLTQTAA